MFLSNFKHILKKDVLNLLEIYSNNKTVIQRIVYLNIISFCFLVRVFIKDVLFNLINIFNSLFLISCCFVVLNLCTLFFYFFIYNKISSFVENLFLKHNVSEISNNVLESNDFLSFFKSIIQNKSLDNLLTNMSREHENKNESHETLKENFDNNEFLDSLKENEYFQEDCHNENNNQNFF